MRYRQLRMPLTVSGAWGDETVLYAETIGHGSYRRCFALDERTVVKIATSDSGFACNQHEVEIWQSATAELRKHLADILSWAADYSWVIMRRAKDVGNVAPRNVPRVLRQSIVDVEYHGNNVGRIGRTVVAVDYGEYAGWHSKPSGIRFGF